MLVKELEQLMRQDRAQRRQQLSTIPVWSMLSLSTLQHKLLSLSIYI